MQVEFTQGVPPGCVEWLWKNVGRGNISQHKGTPNRGPTDSDAWFYERVSIPVTPESFGDDLFKYVPTITVKDAKKATLFALRWS